MLSVAAIRNAGVAWLNVVLSKVRSWIYVKRGGRLKKGLEKTMYVILAFVFDTYVYFI